MGIVLLIGLLVSRLIMPLHGGATNAHNLRLIAAKNNVTSILVFGDSTVDPGNNNRLATEAKCNFSPYGKDFYSGQPTGRFSNGRLATDFIAEALGYTKTIKAFFDPQLEKSNMLHGVSFASAASGYDDLTANISNVLPVSRQLEYFMHYKIHLRQLVGEKMAEEIIDNALFVISMGTNDFLQNYYVDPTRPQQFTVEQYEDFLISRLSLNVKGMHRLGARRVVVVGVPAFGCIPLSMTLRNEKTCDDTLNKVAFSFNSKIKQELANLKISLGIQTAYIDTYNVIETAAKNPKLYGFTVTSRGCCGSGTFEYGNTCKGLSVCFDRTKYMFWDAVHPTEKMYKIIADEAVKSLTIDFLN